MPRSLDGHRQFTLMPHTIPGNTTRNDTPTLSQKVSEQAGILEIDRYLIQTKSTGTSSLK